MSNKFKNRIHEYNLRSKKHSQYINKHLQYINKQNELQNNLKKTGFINLPLKILRQQYSKQLQNEGYLPQDIEEILKEEYNSQGITKYNYYEIKKIQNKLIHVKNYIRFLEKKISRTS